MFETLLSVLGNPHFEAWVGGALSSLIINKLLQGANTARSEDRPHLPPSQRFQGSPQAPAKKEFAQDTRSGRPSLETRGRSSNNDGAEAATIAVAAIVFFAAIFFASFLPAIAGTIYYAASTIAAFSLTTAILAAWNSRLSARELLLERNRATRGLPGRLVCRHSGV